ncbi:MAG: hypothetical protein Q8R82_12765 [Hyphomonadaceae bacterium]|nr:hypothetical protein [Hyphomonadaceae bacterium]
MSDQTLASMKLIPAADLGGPGAPEATQCSRAAIALLGEAAGDGFRMTSLSLDVASHAIGEGMVEIAVSVDKRARSIVFASLEARMGAALVFSAQGLFSLMR